jgi:hypothetical protein
MNIREYQELQDAYQGVYQELDEVRGGGRIDPVSDFPHHGERARSPKDAGLKMSPIDRAEARANALKKRNDPEATKRANRISSRFIGPTKRGIGRAIDASNAARSAEKKRLMNPQESYEYDTFDAILEHLVAEGYADTNENALAIMENMSEEWKESIVEEVLEEGKKEFPETKVREKAAKHEEDYIKKRNPKSMSRARKMKGIASTVEVGDDPRNTMHGQDLRKIR